MRQMSARSWDILQCLMKDPFTAMTAQQLARKLGVSERTVRYEIAALSDWLGERGITLERVPRKGFFVASQDVARAAEIAFEGEGAPDAESVYLSAEQRANAIVSALLDETCPKTMAGIADALGVSRATAARDLKRAGEWLSSHGVPLATVPTGGWSLEAGEYRRRQVMAEFVGEGLGGYAGLLAASAADYDEEIRKKGFVCEEQLERMATALDRYLDETNDDLTDAAFIEMTCYLNAVRHRTCQGHYVSELPGGLDEVPTDERRALEALLSAVGAEAEGESLSREVEALAAMLAASPRMRADSSGVIRAGTAERILNTLLSVASEETGCDLYLDTELVDGLRVHVRALLARERLGLQAKCELLPDIRKRFPELFETCARAMLAAQGEYGLAASDDEVAFVVLYVGAALERLRQGPTFDRSVRAVLVCGAGIGTVAFLSRSLAKEFSHLEIVAKLSTRDCYAFDYSGVDVVLTTVELPQALPRPVIRVTPMLTRVDVRRIEAFLHSPTNGDEGVFVSRLLDVVRANCDVRDEEALERGVRELLGMGGGEERGKLVLPGFLGLDELVSEEFVEVGVVAETWEDAVARASRPLLDAGWMTEDYYRGILDFAERYEQFGVILAPLCAPHTEPDERNRPAISVVTLAEPVRVRMSGEDVPLSVVMVLCLQTPVAHSAALDELFSIVDEYPGFIPALEAAPSPAALVSVVYEYCRRVRA